MGAAAVFASGSSVVPIFSHVFQQRNLQVRRAKTMVRCS
jgi:hypothetical protein